MNSSKTLGKVLRLVRSFWPQLLLSLVMATLHVAMNLYIPILVGNAIDAIIDAGNVNFAVVKEHLLGVGICAVIAAVSQWLMTLINNRITYQVSANIRNLSLIHI